MLSGVFPNERTLMILSGTCGRERNRTALPVNSTVGIPRLRDLLKQAVRENQRSLSKGKPC